LKLCIGTHVADRRHARALVNALLDILGRRDGAYLKRGELEPQALKIVSQRVACRVGELAR